MNSFEMAGEIGSRGEGDSTFRTAPLTPMMLYFMIIPVMAGFEQVIWLRTRIECANVRSEISEDMPPERRNQFMHSVARVLEHISRQALEFLTIIKQ